MELIADLLLVSGSLGASFYCFILGRKLTRFNSLEKGIGGAVAVLSAQVDDLEKTLNSARKTAQISADTLTQLTEDADKAARDLKLQIASLHDLPTPSNEPSPSSTKTPEPMFVRFTRDGTQH
ncbi:MAG: hypothetical protein ABJG56_01225 [Lentilitoribacter sp.]